MENIEENMEIMWVGINPRKRIWGYISYNSEFHKISNTRFASIATKLNRYTFWGTHNGALLFARTYQPLYILKKHPSKIHYINYDCTESLKKNIEYSFSNHLLVQKLKYIF